MKCLSTKAALRTLHYISSYFVYHIVTGICTDTCIQQVEIHISLADLSVGSVTSSLMDESTSILFLVHVFYARKNSYFTQLLSTTLFDKPILNCREDFALGAPDLQITSKLRPFGMSVIGSGDYHNHCWHLERSPQIRANFLCANQVNRTSSVRYLW